MAKLLMGSGLFKRAGSKSASRDHLLVQLGAEGPHGVGGAVEGLLEVQLGIEARFGLGDPGLRGVHLGGGGLDAGIVGQRLLNRLGQSQGERGRWLGRTGGGCGVQDADGQHPQTDER